VEHLVDFIVKISERVIALSAGEIIFDGTPQEVVSDKGVIEAYLGTSGVGRA
jgi:ABC-type branched-subunit amino acid transport system ATPase component